MNNNRSNYESIKCPVCLHEFDAEKRVPKIFPACGHTICKECLIQVLKMDRPECPLDKLRFDRDFRKIEAFPTNFLGKDLLEMEGSWSKCEIHQEQKKIICLTDKALVCSSCAIFGDHKGHDIRRLSDYLEVANQKKDQLSVMSDKISKASSQLVSSLEENKQTMRIAVKERFESLRTVIAKQETQILSKLETVFMEEKIKLQTMLSTTESSDIASHIKNKLKEFRDIKSNTNIIEMIQEDFTDLEKSLNESLSLSTTKMTEELSELISLLQNSLPNENTLQEFDLITSLTQKLSEYNAKRNFKFEDQITHIKEVAIPSVELNITLESNNQILKVEESSSAKSYTFDKLKLDQVQEVQYSLVTDEHADERVLPALIWISKFLPNLKSIKFNFQSSSRSSSEHRIYSILSATLSQPENLESIDIKANNTPLGDLSAIFLAEKVLPKIKNLKSLICGFYQTKITGKALKAFTQANLSAQRNLQKFTLNATKASLKDEDVAQFLQTVPNVKDLLLGFGLIDLTDQALQEFSTKILPSLDKIERFELGFQYSKITGAGIHKFLMNLPSSVTNLLMGLTRLEITDTIMESFLAEKLPSLRKLEELTLGLSDTQVSQNILREISQWKEKVVRGNQATQEELSPNQTEGLLQQIE